jgi:hypothetical protein
MITKKTQKKRKIEKSQKEKKLKKTNERPKTRHMQCLNVVDDIEK